MTLSEAVRGAKTPEDLLKILQEIARRYVVARDEEQKYALVKGEIREACVEALSRLETDVHEWDFEGKRFRAKTYPISRVKPTQQLVDLLVARGLGDLVTRKIEIDDRGLFREVRRGTISVEEIRLNSEISKSEGFRITELKPEKDEEVEE